MASEWRESAFRDLLQEPVRNGIYKTKQFHGRGTKVINMGELFAFPRLRSVPMKRVELTAVELDRFSVQARDLIFARRSLVAEGAGKCSIVLEVDEPTTFESSLIRARVDKSKADADFLYYLFSSPQGVHHLDTILRHVAVAGITGKDLMSLKLRIPGPELQSEIAQILGTLDDRIELNQKMNKTLVAMVRSLFQSWFIDFDPVHANAESRDTGLPSNIAKLFPNSFDDRELERLPKGWRSIPLYDIAEFSNGAAYRDMHFSSTNEGLPVIKIAELKAGVTESTRFTTTELGEKYRIDQRDVLFSWSGNPDTSIDTFIWDGGPAWLNQHIFRVRENGTASRTWIYCLLKSLRPVFAEIARDKQTTGLGHVTIADMKRLMVCQPTPEVAKAFDAFAAPILERVFSNQLQIHSLNAIRDKLLPKLISGQLRIKQLDAVEASL